jgi:hypothetical protein
MVELLLESRKDSIKRKQIGTLVANCAEEACGNYPILAID